jgi:hypothetical protein
MSAATVRMSPHASLVAIVSVALAAIFLAAGAAAAGEESPVDTARARPTIVFLLPVGAPDVVLAALPRALGAHLTGTGVNLVFSLQGEATTWSARPLLERARRERTLGIYLLDVNGAPRTSRWHLYLAEPASGRWLSRAIDAGDDASAAVESVAIIVRRATLSLLEQRMPEMDPAPLPALARAASPSTAGRAPVVVGAAAATSTAATGVRQDPAGIELGLGYRRAGFAPELPWSGGLDLSLAYASAAGWVARLGYTHQAAVDMARPEGRFTLRQLPFRLASGYRLGLGRVALEAEGSLAMDIVVRAAGPAGPGFTATGNGTRVAWAPGAAARMELGLARHLRAFVLGGADVYMNVIKYLSDSPSGGHDVLLAPRRLRTRLGFGVSVAMP